MRLSWEGMSELTIAIYVLCRVVLCRVVLCSVVFVVLRYAVLCCDVL